MDDKKKLSRVKDRGKRTIPSSQSCSPSPSPPPSPQQTREELPQSPRRKWREGSPSTSRVSSRSHSPSTHPQKKPRICTDLTSDQEDDMASWLEMNDLIYNKKVNAYKDYMKKDALWESKAADMDKDVAVLKTWYRSIRTRYTRLVHRRSGDGASDLTEREWWILENFAWLNPHVIEVKKKTVNMEKIAGAASVEVVDLDDHQSEADDVVRAVTPTETIRSSRQRMEPHSRRSSASSAKASQEEERLLSDIATRGEQSIAFQAKVLEIMAPPKATERTAFGDWAKEVMVSLHPSLWLKFQRECSNLLYTYQEKSEEILHTVTHVHIYSAKRY